MHTSAKFITHRECIAIHYIEIRKEEKSPT